VIVAKFLRSAPASILLAFAVAACVPDGSSGGSLRTTGAAADGSDAGRPGERIGERNKLVNTIHAKGIRDQRVLDAIAKVPRHEFVPAEVAELAYEDIPLPIGYGQTISQPFIVAVIIDALEVEPGARVLEIGTGSGYQAAVLAELGAEVYTIEIVGPLAERAREDLARLGYDRVHVKSGDGYAGWPDHAPFDRIMITAVAPKVPEPLVEQLATGGILVMPLEESEDGRQWLQVLRKNEDGSLSKERTLAVRFVPMTGKVREPTED
jgi:protein-L-isoaspartate(D-aspartate) O-methyltransferase